MDEGLSRAVLKVFVELYSEGLIYKDKRLVNWDPKLQTAISDLEVVRSRRRGTSGTSKISDRGRGEARATKFIVRATTRPETMLGDTAVAVNPDDERLRSPDSRQDGAVLPLVGRADPDRRRRYADPEKGTGAVKITPAHDFNDFEVGRRHDL